jgi:hypothetical protein
MTTAFGEFMSEGNQKNPSTPADPEAAGKKLTPAAERARAEAAARRAAEAAKVEERPKEFQGREGPDPARYGDWETKGIASDF